MPGRCCPLPPQHTRRDQLAQHRQKGWMRAHRFGAYTGHPTGGSGMLGLDVEIVEHLDMIAQKANGCDDHLAIPLGVHLPDGVVDVWL